MNLKHNSMNDQRFKRKSERKNSVTDSKNSTRRLTTGNCQAKEHLQIKAETNSDYECCGDHTPHQQFYF